MIDEITEDAEKRMGKSVDSLQVELAKIRTGRAHPSLLDHITVEYYGSETALSQVSNVSVEEADDLERRCVLALKLLGGNPVFWRSRVGR